MKWINYKIFDLGIKSSYPQRMCMASLISNWKLVGILYSNLHSYQGAALRNSVSEYTFPVETSIHCRMLCHLMSRLVLGRMDSCQQQHSEHQLVQTLYTGSDNDMSRRYRDPSLTKINK